MYVEGLEIRGFRGMDTQVPLSFPLAILVGENNAGKSTVVDALRLVTAPYQDTRSRSQIRPEDFTHDGTGNRIGEALRISLLLTDLDSLECGRMVTCLTPARGRGTARLSFNARLNESGRVISWFTGGDLENTDIEPIARTAVRHVYMPALRDAARDMRPGYSNRLAELISAFAPHGGADRERLEGVVNAANSELAAVPAVLDATRAIAESLEGLVGAGAFRQKSDMQFSPARYERIVSSLRALMGRLAPLELEENGLGYNNLLYMAVLLSVLQKAEESPLQVLLVEEPEAHLHPQLQSLLMEFLEGQSDKQTQVVLTTHSAQLASSARVERMTVMSTRGDAKAAHHLGSPGSHQAHLGHLRRFLDATKSSLLFAKGVVLVEGIAEQVLMPELAKRSGISLTHHGVAVVNIGGLAFAPFTTLFTDEGLPARCAVVSDADPEVPDGPYVIESLGTSATARTIHERATEQVQPFFATRTLEWDLAYTEDGANRAVLTAALSEIHPRVAERLAGLEMDAREWADEFLQSVRRSKGDFSLQLSVQLANPDLPFFVPPYISSALAWVTERQNEEGMPPSASDADE